MENISYTEDRKEVKITNRLMSPEIRLSKAIEENLQQISLGSQYNLSTVWEYQELKPLLSYLFDLLLYEGYNPDKVTLSLHSPTEFILNAVRHEIPRK